VGRVHRLLKKGNYAQRVGAGTPGEHSVTFFPWLMFPVTCRCVDLAAEILELAGSSARDNKKQCIFSWLSGTMKSIL